MVTAHELLRQGKHQELWQMCCGFLSLTIDEFMGVQERLLIKQIEILNRSPMGKKLLHGSRPESVEEFRRLVPLTTYKDYCPELLEKQEEALPVKPLLWAHTSGRTGEYPFKWVPLTPEYARELSVALYGVGILSCCKDWGDTSRMSVRNKVLFSVARRPYISGVFADILKMQIPLDYLPPQEQAENQTFEERLKLGFQEAMSQGLDYFFGLSLVLVSVGEKFRQSSQKVDIRPFLGQPKALFRLSRGKLKSLLAKRQLLPRDLWSIKGIIGSGIDSWIYKEKIREYWGRPPLDLYSCTEGGVIAAQTWDYDGMTFIPNLNFLEFIPEDEQLKNMMDRSYQPKTLLLNELKAGENYEIIITNFHGGVMTRYRLGDMIRITSLRNETLGIGLPQVAFERRVDDTVDFGTVHLTEKIIWQALEKSGVDYTDWVAYRIPGQQVLNLFVEPKDGIQIGEKELASNLRNYLVNLDRNNSDSGLQQDLMDMIGFDLNVHLLKEGTFSGYIAQKQAEGADLAHIKPPHINASGKVLSLLLGEDEEIIATKVKEAEQKQDETDKVTP
jgi:hypothetical protein